MPKEVSEKSVEQRAEENKKPKRKWLRRTLWTLGVIVVVVVALVLLLPTLLSTGPGTRLVLGLASDATGMHITASNLDVGWLGGQRIDNLKVNQPGDRIYADIPLVRADDLSLASLVVGGRDLGKVEVRGNEARYTKRASKAPSGSKPPGRSKPSGGGALKLPAGVRGQITMSMKKLTYADPASGMKPIKMGGLTSDVTIGQNWRVKGKIDTRISQGGQGGSVHAAWDVSDAVAPDGTLQPGTAKVNADANLKNFPVAAADRLTHQGDRLVATLGDRLNLTATLGRTGPAAGTKFHARIQAPRLTGVFEGSRSDQGVSEVHSVKPLTLTLTPDAFAKWADYALAPKPAKPAKPATPAESTGPAQPAASPAKPPYAITAPVTFQLSVKSLRVGFKSGGIDPDLTGIDATASIPRVPLRLTKSGREVTAEGFQVRVQAKSLRDAVNLLLHLKLPAAQGAEEGRVDSTTTIDHLLDPAGRLAPRQARIASDTRVKALPTALIAGFAPPSVPVRAVLGDQASADLKLNYQAGGPGRIDCDLNSGNAQGLIPADIDKNGVVSLRQDAKLRVAITPALSQSVLAMVNPILGHIASAAAPLKINIAKDGFRVPLQDFDVKKVTAAATLDIPRIKLAPQGVLDGLLSTLTRFNVLKEGGNHYTATLTPFRFRVKDGGLAYEGSTVHLGGGLDLTFAGKSDLVDRTIDLSMGLGGDALDKVAALKGTSLRLTGPASHPSLDTQKLVQTLARAGAEQGLQQLFHHGKHKSENKSENKSGNKGHEGNAEGEGGNESHGKDQGPSAKDQRRRAIGNAVGGLLNQVLGGGRQNDRGDKQNDQDQQK